MTWRIAYRFDPISRWRVVDCRNVNDDWASSIVKVERKERNRKRLLVLSVAHLRLGAGSVATPRVVVEGYLASLSDERKAELARMHTDYPQVLEEVRAELERVEKLPEQMAL